MESSMEQSYTQLRDQDVAMVRNRDGAITPEILKSFSDIRKDLMERGHTQSYGS